MWKTEGKYFENDEKLGWPWGSYWVHQWDSPIQYGHKMLLCEETEKKSRL